ncbi:MAG: endolytic transglycosylase MltG [Paracoccaceae bacterium]|nr:endolytic transglycosylase MltG [Paracoccaceae bacterium]MDE3237364.1 endolytic transglycosylase MltG [Paracoccaceae bacterium]
MGRSIASNALTLFIVLFLAVAGVIAWGQKTYHGPGPLAQAICVRVDRGANVAGISRDLLAKGAISNGLVFRLGAQYSDKSAGLRYGSYLVQAHASMADIMDVLTKGGQSTCGTEVNFRIGVTSDEIVVRKLDPASDTQKEVAKFDPMASGPAPEGYTQALQEPDTRYRVILAEGVTSWQVTESLKKADFLTGAIDKEPPEGGLAPQSYEVTKGESRAALIAKMQARQAAILTELWAKRADGLPYKTPQEALIMASLIEKETGVASERAKIASVFLNRLAQGIRLQTDPAVIYGITKGHGELGRGLRVSELRAKTPYNTYVISGLPPTPIANPGKAAIEAALHPADTKYLYFVATGTGGHVFAETLAEHNKNVAQWRAFEAKQQADKAGN